MVTKTRLIYLLVTLNLLLLLFVGLRESGIAPRAYISSNAQAVPPPVAENGTAQQRRSEIVVAAEKVSPAVVSVGASQTGYIVSPFASYFSEYMLFPYQEKVPYLGSGVIIDPEGYVITNHHVVGDASGIFVTLMDGRELEAKLLDADVILDIALLKINNATDLPYLKLGNSDNLMVGEWVLALGNPFGNLIEDPRPTVTAGVVSATKRSFRPNGNLQRVYMDMIQTDAAINPGNSGGALVNMAGELVGMNTFIMSKSGGAEGIGFAVPANRIKAVAEEIRTHGRVRSPLVDFHVQNLSPQLAKLIDTKAKEGAVVSELNHGGPAERAGMKIGDVIVGVDNRNVKDAQDAKLNLWTKQVGEKAVIEVERQGKRVKLEYQLQEARSR